MDADGVEIFQEREFDTVLDIRPPRVFIGVVADGREGMVWTNLSRVP